PRLRARPPGRHQPRAGRLPGRAARHVLGGARGRHRGALLGRSSRRAPDHDQLPVQVRAGEGGVLGGGMAALGRLAICLALLFAAYATGVSILGAIRRRRHLVRSGTHAAYAVFALVVVAVAILLHALVEHDFSLEYVAAYSSSTLPVQYTVAALWGGQKGSLLFWAFMLTLFTTIVQVQNRERNRELMPWVTATLMTTAAFFLGLLTFVTDPFERLPIAARE